MKKETLAYLVLIAAIILLIFNIGDLIFKTSQSVKGPLLGILSNVLLMLCMVAALIEFGRSKRKN